MSYCFPVAEVVFHFENYSLHDLIAHKQFETLQRHLFPWTFVFNLMTILILLRYPFLAPNWPLFHLFLTVDLVFFFFLIEEINAICLKLSLFLSVLHHIHSHWPRKWRVCVRSAFSWATHQNISAWVPPHRESYYIVWNEAWTLFLFVCFLQPPRWF